MRDALKQFAMMVVANMVAITLVVGAAFLYLNYEAKKTLDQVESLRKIEDLNNPASTQAFPGNVPDAAPEIYGTEEKDINEEDKPPVK